MTDYLTATQAASRLGKSEKTIRRWIQEGRLHAHHPQGRKNMLAISEGDIEQLATELAKYEQPGHQDTSELESRIDALERRVDKIQNEKASRDLYITDMSYIEQRLARLEDVLLSLAGPEPTAASRPAQKRATASLVSQDIPVDIPAGSLLHTVFAEHHNVNSRTFRDQLDRQKMAIKRAKLNRPNEVERWLSPEQQQQAVDYWKEQGTTFTARPTLFPTLDYGILSEQEQDSQKIDAL